MRRALAISVLIAALTGGSCARQVAVQLPQPSPGAPAFSKQVLAFYYGWYGNPQTSGQWVHWTDVDASASKIGNSTHYPQLGPYDSHDPRIIDQHFRWAKDAGITGFIVSWWRQGDFHDQGMPLMLEAARRVGLSITIYFEQVKPRESPAPDGAIDDLLYLLERYGGSPAWLKVRGKPVVFVYARALQQIGLDGWQTVVAAVNQRYRGGALFIGDRISVAAARVFDGVHTYNPTGATAGKSPDDLRAWARSAFVSWIAAAGVDQIACVTVLAGYDDRLLGRPPPRPTTDRYGGETYRALWEEAIVANPDWILLCSWNEWHEGSEIEPSLEHGDRELKTTAEFARKFVAMPMRTASPKR